MPDQDGKERARGHRGRTLGKRPEYEHQVDNHLRRLCWRGSDAYQTVCWTRCLHSHCQCLEFVGRGSGAAGSVLLLQCYKCLHTRDNHGFEEETVRGLATAHHGRTWTLASESARHSTEGEVVPVRTALASGEQRQENGNCGPGDAGPEDRSSDSSDHFYTPPEGSQAASPEPAPSSPALQAVSLRHACPSKPSPERVRTPARESAESSRPAGVTPAGVVVAAPWMVLAHRSSIGTCTSPQRCPQNQASGKLSHQPLRAPTVLPAKCHTPISARPPDQPTSNGPHNHPGGSTSFYAPGTLQGPTSPAQDTAGIKLVEFSGLDSECSLSGRQSLHGNRSDEDSVPDSQDSTLLLSDSRVSVPDRGSPASRVHTFSRIDDDPTPRQATLHKARPHSACRRAYSLDRSQTLAPEPAHRPPAPSFSSGQTVSGPWQEDNQQAANGDAAGCQSAARSSGTGSSPEPSRCPFNFSGGEPSPVTEARHARSPLVRRRVGAAVGEQWIVVRPFDQQENDKSTEGEEDSTCGEETCDSEDPLYSESQDKHYEKKIKWVPSMKKRRRYGGVSPAHKLPKRAPAKATPSKTPSAKPTLPCQPAGPARGGKSREQGRHR